ncbi:hypothetical protein SSP24_82630 [Streptomyces spinoverrucosus]|uniref:Uncharacterized protein n=1 Tax=Streptomyces spinoverrucosus TaxID=284043 RepID=A0A4Y3VWK3_9ACTN|nr:hypothetical protein SSP24_82630 [Streptomyces spinoverrucosus]GHB65273.1 hypothetical protein GCM10010397_39070 [Streptomyces spinoverrucosus]
MHGFVVLAGVEQGHGEEGLQGPVIGELGRALAEDADRLGVPAEYPVGAAEAEESSSAFLVRQP